jgi:required for meiotic nuclear division protein 1
MNPIAAAGKTSFAARALLVSQRMDLRSLGAVDRLAPDPVTLAAGASGLAVLFRYGVVVLFNVAPLEEGELLRQLQPLLQQPLAAPEVESVEIRIDPAAREGIEGSTIVLNDASIERLQLVAEILGKSVLLAMYEGVMKRNFEIVEPFAVDLETKSRTNRNARELLKHIGTALLSEHNMVGRAEVVDKPDLLWEHPDLERLYSRLEDDFEIAERHQTLENKLELVSRTAMTALNLLQDRRNLRVEWYIVILIVVEILLTLYQMFFSGRGA